MVAYEAILKSRKSRETKSNRDFKTKHSLNSLVILALNIASDHKIQFIPLLGIFTCFTSELTL